MSVHITKTYNIGGLIGLRQNAIRNAGEALGFKEMSLFKFPDQYDSDEELDVRMDGIISALCPDDIVIFQYPSGESPRYNNCLFKHIRMYAGTKIIVYVQGISNEDEINLLNKADMFIFASEELRDHYLEKGLEEKKYIISKVADYMTDISVNEHEKRNLYMLVGNDSEAPKLSDVEMISYDEYHVPEMIIRLSQGGMGLIFNRDEQALSLYMAAGIPVIVKKGLSCEKYVLENQLGFVVDGLEDASSLFSTLPDEKLNAYYENVRKVKNLFVNGVYTKQMLLKTVILATEK